MGILAAISYTPLVEIELGPISVSPHGLGIAIGFLIGAQFMLPTSRRKGIPDDLVYPLFTRAAIGAIIGSRLAYVLNHIGDYLNPLDILRVWEGGISLIGGMLGAIALALPGMRSKGLSFWKVMDAAMPGLALGIVVGRIGDLVIADHLGTSTDFFLGYRCPPPGIETGSPCLGEIVHQTALYDQILAAVLLVVLLRLRRKPRFDGFITMVFGLGYGLARLTEDFLREDVRRFGLTGSQWTALGFIVLCTYGLTFVRRTPRWGRWDEGVARSPSLGSEASPAEPDPPDPPDRGERGDRGDAAGGGDQVEYQQSRIKGPPPEGDGNGDQDRSNPVAEGDRG